MDDASTLPVPAQDSATTRRDDPPTVTGAVEPPRDSRALSPAPARESPFEILSELGRGGMGIVYLARQRGLDRKVALKTLKAGDAASPDQLRRFEQEARAAAKLHHPGIVGVYEVGDMDGGRYIAMEYVDGRRMDHWARDRRADLRTRVDLLRRVAEAVDHAHRAGIVHRDLKPGNVLVDADGAPHVADFGLAKELESESEGLTRSGATIGTPQYMSPEQVRSSKDTDGRTDVWALGVMLYEALAGRRPFEGETGFAILTQVMELEPVPPRRWDARLPVDLEAVCLRALEKDAAHRYASAGEFAAELARLLGGEPVLARRPGPLLRAWRWTLRHRIPVAAAVAFFAITGGLWTRGRMAEQIADAERERAAGAEARRQEMLAEMHAKVSSAVRRFEDTIRRVPMPAEAQQALAGQPLETLDSLIAGDPACGPLYSWRGEVYRLLGDDARAEADFARGCELAPEQAVPWYLRGMYWIDRYSRTRPLPGISVSLAGADRRDRSETAPERELRGKAEADLARMLEVAGGDALIGPAHAALGRAQAALNRGGEEGWKEALAQTEGLESPMAAKLRGKAWFYLGDHDRSIAEFTRALETWKVDPGTRDARGITWFALAAARRRSGADPRAALEHAIADFTDALRGTPDDIAPYLDRGAAWNVLGEVEEQRGADPRGSYAKAIADFGEALRCEPGAFEAHHGRGIALALLGEAETARGLDATESFRKAIAEFDETLRVTPDEAGVRNNRGNACLGLGRAEARRGVDPRASYAAAIADFDVVLGRDPGRVEARVNRGSTRVALGEIAAAAGQDPSDLYRAAIEDYSEALRLQPALSAARANRGQARFRLGEAQAARRIDPREEYRRAIEDFVESIRLDPDASGVRVDLANARLYLGQAEAALGGDPRKTYEQALTEYDEALRREPGNGGASSGRGLCWFSLGEAQARRGIDPGASFAHAEADYRAGMARGSVEAGMNLGLLCRATGRFDEAIAAFQSGARANPAYAGWAQQNVEETQRMKRAAGVLAEPWAAELAAADRAVRAGNPAEARAAYERGLAQSGTGTPEALARREADPAARAIRRDAHYNLACLLSLESAKAGSDAAARDSLRDAAFVQLERALALGWANRAHLEADPDLAALRGDSRWAPLLARVGGGK